MFYFLDEIDFDAGGFPIRLNSDDSLSLVKVLQEMPELIESLLIAIKDGDERLPRSIEDTGILLGAIEIAKGRKEASAAHRRLHYALRQHRSPEPEAGHSER